MRAEPSTVRVVVRPLAGVVPTGAVLRVDLVDDGPADAMGTRLDRAELRGWDGQEVAVTLLVPPGPEPALASWGIVAHLGASEQVTTGDWLSTAACPVQPGETVAVELAPVV